MKKRILILSLSALLTVCLAVGTVFALNFKDYSVKKTQGNQQFEYDGNFTAPELLVDGVGDDEIWTNLDWLYTGVKSTDPAVQYPAEAKIKMYLGQTSLYVYFEVTDYTLMAVAENNQTDKVCDGDSVEFYLCTHVDASNRPQKDDYQINIDINGFSRIMQGTGSAWGNISTLLVDYEISLIGGETIDDITGYGVELMFPYSQSGMVKGDDIAFAFGLVDKYDSAITNKTWTGIGVDPQIPSGYKVLSGKDGQIYDMGQQPMDAVSLTGKVTDKSGAPLEGVKVEMLGGSYVMTDANGLYVIPEVTPANVNLSFSLDGYVSNIVGIDKNRMIQATGGKVVTDVTLELLEGDPFTNLVGKVTTAGVPYANAQVKVVVDGETYTATTDENGYYALNAVPYDSYYFVSVKGGNYTEKTVTVDIVNANKNTEVETVDIMDYNNTILGSTFGGANGTAKFIPYFERLETGYVFHFETAYNWVSDGARIELFIDAGTTSLTTQAERDASNEVFICYLYASGKYDIFVRSSNNLDTEGTIYTVGKTANNMITATIYIPYTYLNKTAQDVIGICLGSYGGGWDGWGVDQFKGFNGIGFVAPEIPADYIRINTDNTYFENDLNAVPTPEVNNDAAQLTYGTVNLDEYATFGASFFGGLNSSLRFTPYADRNGNNLLMVFVTSISAAEVENLASSSYGIEMFLDVGDNKRTNQDSDVYRFDISLAKGTVTCYQFNGGIASKTDIAKNSMLGLTYDRDSGLLYVTLNIDLTLVNSGANEVVGISLGSLGSPWDGWTYEQYFGSNNSGFVAPEIPADYIRIGKVTDDNAVPTIYWASSNTAQAGS